MLTLMPICKEAMDYIEEQLLLRGFDKRGKLFIRRSGPIVATVYPRWEHNAVEDYRIGVRPLWFCPDKIVLLREGAGSKDWQIVARRIAGGAIAAPTPEYPFRNMTTVSYPTLVADFNGGLLTPLNEKQLRDILDCTLLAPLDFRATYNGEKYCAEFIRNARHFFNARYFLMYEKNLSDLRADVKMEQDFREGFIRQHGKYPEQMESKYQQALQILQAAENSDWTPAEQLLAQMSAGGLALLKRYHIEDKGPYPKEFARLSYDD